MPTNSHERELAVDVSEGGPARPQIPEASTRERGQGNEGRPTVGYLVLEDGVSGEVGEDRALCLMAIGGLGPAAG